MTHYACDLSAYRIATRNNTSPRRAVIVDAWPHVGIGHSLRSAALWLRYVSLVAPDRAVRFASCVPHRLAGAFSENEHEVPSCAARVWDPIMRANVSAVRFDLHEFLSLAGLQLRASRSDFAALPRRHGWRPRAIEDCIELRRQLRRRAPQKLILYGSKLRDLIGMCTALELRGETTAARGPNPQIPSHAFSCLRHVHTVGAASAVAQPRCGVGLHLRSMRLDDKACDLLGSRHDAASTASGGGSSSSGINTAAGGAAPQACAFAWRARRCPNQPLARLVACRASPSAAASAAGTAAAARGLPPGSLPPHALFATADAPHLYRATRPHGWSDLDEEASVTWNERRTTPYPAQLADVPRTAAAFVALARCTHAIVAPVVSHFSETAAMAAGVPLVGCCDELPAALARGARGGARER